MLGNVGQPGARQPWSRRRLPSSASLLVTAAIVLATACGGPSTRHVATDAGARATTSTAADPAAEEVTLACVETGRPMTAAVLDYAIDPSGGTSEGFSATPEGALDRFRESENAFRTTQRQESARQGVPVAPGPPGTPRPLRYARAGRVAVGHPIPDGVSPSYRTSSKEVVFVGRDAQGDAPVAVAVSWYAPPGGWSVEGYTMCSDFEAQGGRF